MTPAQLARIAAAIERDAEVEASNWPMARKRARAYLELARAVQAERWTHAEIMGNLESRVIPDDGLYTAHDAAMEAVETALAALAPEEAPDASAGEGGAS